MLAGTTAGSGKKARATVELNQAHKTISTQSRELAKIAQFKFSLKIPKDNVVFYETNEENLKGKLAKVTVGRKRLGQLFDSTHL